MGKDEWELLTRQIRGYNLARLRELLDTLGPYVDGSFGSINPAHVKVYLQALRELGMVGRIYAPPKEEVVVDQVEQPVLEARRQAVLDQLAAIVAKRAGM